MILNMKNFNNTIAAISTPRGIGGLAVVRLSGEEAVSVADQVFRGNRKLTEVETQRALVGQIIEISDDDKVVGRKSIGENLKVVDEVVATVFRQPHSFTGEDIVEITCHGGPYISEQILQLLLRHGAHLAEPGEFTRRAFINGRIDLVQAEAVADLIAAKTEQSHRASMQLLTGAFSKKLNALRDQLVESCSLLELELDFSDEDVEFVDREKMLRQIDRTEKKIESLINSYQYGKIIREGVRLVIIGRPNVGKSSLLNAMLRDERAIVTEIPGTTRDTLEEDLDIDGYLFHVTDTAGFQQPQNIIESEGIKRSEKALREADIILHVVDGSEYLKKEDLDIFTKSTIVGNNEHMETKRTLIVQNKIDLPQLIDENEIRQVFKDCEVVKISAKTYAGLDLLEKIIVKQIKNIGDGPRQRDIAITRTRHRDALLRSRQWLLGAKSSCERGLSGEFIALDLRASLDALGEVVGKVTSTEILNKIFSDFCIGK